MNRTEDKVEVRAMAKGDCRAAAAFCARTMKWMQKTYLKGYYPEEATARDVSSYSEARMRERLSDRDKFTFLALRGCKVCGIAAGMVFSDSGLGMVTWVSVDPEHQHEGVGMRLMVASEEFMKGRMCHKITVNTLPPLVPAIRLYMKFGLLPEAYLRKAWWGADFLVMSKWIATYRKHTSRS